MLIRWLLASEGTRGSFVRCLHSNRGGEFRSDVLGGFCGEQGIIQSWTLPDSPQHNGPYAVRHAVYKLNLWPRVSRPGDSPTSLWTGSPGCPSPPLPRPLSSSCSRSSGTRAPPGLAPSAGGTGTRGASSEGAGARGAGAGVSGTGGANSEATGAGATTTVVPTAPPHCYDMSLQDLHRLERKEQERLEQERQELRQLDQQEQQQVQQEQ
ncbi:unnamed protein product [Closterium sp. NIES-53]